VDQEGGECSSSHRKDRCKKSRKERKRDTTCGGRTYARDITRQGERMDTLSSSVQSEKTGQRMASGCEQKTTVVDLDYSAIRKKNGKELRMKVSAGTRRRGGIICSKIKGGRQKRRKNVTEWNNFLREQAERKFRREGEAPQVRAVGRQRFVTRYGGKATDGGTQRTRTRGGLRYAESRQIAVKARERVLSGWNYVLCHG